MSILQPTDVTTIITRLGGPSIVSANDVAMITNDLAPSAEIAVKEYLGYDVEQAAYTDYLPIADARQPEASLDSRNWNDNYGSGNRNMVSTPVSEIFVRQYPLRQIVNVWENQIAWVTDGVNGDWSDSFKLAIGSDFTVDWDEPAAGGSLAYCLSRSLWRFGGWPYIGRTVRVDYVAGFTAAELLLPRWNAIKQAVMTTVKMWYLYETSLRRGDASGGTGFGVVTGEGIGDWHASYDIKIFDGSAVPQKAKQMLRNHVSMSKFFAR